MLVSLKDWTPEYTPKNIQMFFPKILFYTLAHQMYVSRVYARNNQCFPTLCASLTPPKLVYISAEALKTALYYHKEPYQQNKYETLHIPLVKKILGDKSS